MNEKKIFFLAGIPRAGNTLISSILNQNPDIKVTPYSFLLEYVYLLDSKYRNHEATVMCDSYSILIDEFLKKILPTFYDPLECKYVIDRCPDWGTKYNLDMLRRIHQNEIKIISPVRNILEVLSSFIEKIHTNEHNNFVDKQLYQDQVPIYRTLDDARCDELMKPGGQIDSALHTLSQSKLPENKDIFHLVDYNDLVRNPKKEIKKIYNFLDIKYYEDHYYENIEEFSFMNRNYNDNPLGMNLHQIRTNGIEKTSRPYQKVLSKYTINKYRNSETWK